MNKTHLTATTQSSSLKQRIAALLILSAFAPAATNCGPTGYIPDEGADGYGEPESDDQAAARFQIVVTAPDGMQRIEQGTFEELVGPSLGMLPEMFLDGNPQSDAAGVLQAGQAELELQSGETLLLEREGRTLQRLAPDSDMVSGSATKVEWSETLDTLWVYTAAGVGTITLEGLEDAKLRTRYLGFSAVMLLGGHVGVLQDGEEVHLGPAVLIPLAALGILGWLACVIGGTAACSDAANNNCGTGNVDAVATICGYGFDVNGQMQLGYNCSYRCKSECGAASCDYNWCGTSSFNNCPTGWNGTGDGCDCGCQFTDPDCK